MVPIVTPLVIAHRGASARRPEHTRSAYAQAIADGADGLECDVQLTADGELVCWHDATVDRTSDGSGPVREHTLAQMRGLDITSWAGMADQGDELLTLSDLLALAGRASRPIHVAVELKHPAPYGFAAEDAVVALLEAAGWDPGPSTVGPVTVSFMSFHPGSLQHLAGSVPSEHLMVLVDATDAADLLAEQGLPVTAEAQRTLQMLLDEAVLIVDDGQSGGVGPSVAFVRAHPDKVARWIAGGTLVRVWTVDSAEDLALCRELGVAEVTTNVPDQVLALLGR
ncbi:MAG: glycerophosphodiester phosphodiesterase [Cellulomonadaceae bacterium]|nr:glycerophosphodiester phosphodiesterase [Cellulomonadaceae bacterium]